MYFCKREFGGSLDKCLLPKDRIHQVVFVHFSDLLIHGVDLSR